MTLRLTEADDQLLTERAHAEQRSKQEIAQEAIHQYLTERAAVFNHALATVLENDKDILETLADR